MEIQIFLNAVWLYTYLPCKGHGQKQSNKGKIWHLIRAKSGIVFNSRHKWIGALVCQCFVHFEWYLLKKTTHNCDPIDWHIQASLNVCKAEIVNYPLKL